MDFMRSFEQDAEQLFICKQLAKASNRGGNWIQPQRLMPVSMLKATCTIRTKKQLGYRPFRSITRSAEPG